MRALIPFFAYFSPETVLPVTSIVATIAGIVMMLGRGTLRLMVRSFQRGHRAAAGVPMPLELALLYFDDGRRLFGHGCLGIQGKVAVKRR